MAWTQSDLDKIERAIAAGALRVRFKDHEVTYQSVRDMLRVRDLIRSEIGANSNGGFGVSFAEYHDGR